MTREIAGIEVTYTDGKTLSVPMGSHPIALVAKPDGLIWNMATDAEHAILSLLADVKRDRWADPFKVRA